MDGSGMPRIKVPRIRADRYSLSRRIKKNITLLFLVLLIVVVFQFLFSAFHEWDPLSGYQGYFVVAAIVFGGLAFWYHREKFAMISEPAEEAGEEEDRKAEFGAKFSKINRIPGIRWFTRWMYKEGWVYSIGLILLVVISFGLRISQADLSFWQDEQYAVVSADSLLHHGRMLLVGPMLYGEDVLYYRGIPYTALLAPSFGIFGVNELAARLPGILMGSLTVIILYLFGKEIGSKKLGLTAAALITFWDWHIFLSRWARFYTMTTFLYILVAYLFYKGFIKNDFKYKVAALIAMIIGFWSSPLGLGLLILFIYPVFYRFKGINRKYICLVVVFVILAIIPLCLGDIVPIDSSMSAGSAGSTWSIPSLAAELFSILPRPCFISWLASWFPVMMLLILFAFFTSLMTKDTKKLYPITFLFILLLALVIKGGLNSQPRMLIFLSPLMALSCAIGIWKVIEIVNMKLAITHKKALIFSVGAILCILVSINPFQTFKIATIGYGDELAPHNRFSLLEERYPDYKTAMEYVNDHYQEGDAIIIDSDPHQIYCKHSITAALNRNVPNPTTLEDVLSIIENHDRTWITYGYIDPDSHTYESFKEIWRFLEDNKENMVYKGGDPARAYLFTKDSPLVI